MSTKGNHMGTHSTRLSIARKLERAIVLTLLTELWNDGFRANEVNGGDGPERVRTIAQAVDKVFEFADEARVYFRDPSSGGVLWVYFVLGNGEDVISDYVATPEMEAAVTRVTDAIPHARITLAV